MSELGIIIQARMGSSRLPGKIAADICGETVLRRVVRQCRAIRSSRRVRIAAPYHEEIETMAKAMGVPVFWGPEHDVLERYYLAAREFDADPIIRITADCPLLDPELCDKTVKLFNDGGCSYAAIGEGKTFPRGYGCEVFSQYTLSLANELALSPYDREHVTSWMERNVRCKYLTQDIDQSHMNFSVDTLEDLNRVRAIYAKLNGDTSLAATVRAYGQD